MDTATTLPHHLYLQSGVHLKQDWAICCTQPYQWGLHSFIGGLRYSSIVIGHCFLTLDLFTAECFSAVGFSVDHLLSLRQILHTFDIQTLR